MLCLSRVKDEFVGNPLRRMPLKKRFARVLKRGFKFNFNKRHLIQFYAKILYKT